MEENKAMLEEVQNMIRSENDRGLLSRQRLETKKEIREVNDLWEYMTINEQHAFLQKIINSITIRAGSILIDYNF